MAKPSNPITGCWRIVRSETRPTVSQHFPARLTQAQRKVVAEVVLELAGPHGRSEQSV